MTSRPTFWRLVASVTAFAGAEMDSAVRVMDKNGLSTKCFKSAPNLEF